MMTLSMPRGAADLGLLRTARRRTLLRFAALLLSAGTVACSRGDTKAETGGEAGNGGGSKEANPAGVASEGAESREAAEGSPTAEKRVTLSADAFRTAGIIVEVAVTATAGATGGGLQVPGQVEIDPARLAVISPRASGRLERLLAVPGQRVSAGESVALLFSPAFLIAQSDLVQSKRRSDVLRGTADDAGASALLEAARRRLALIGASEATIRRIEGGDVSQRFIPIVAPFSGSIIENLVLAGQAVEAGTPLYRIADLSVVNVAADVPERAIASVQIGQSASVLPASSTTPFRGRIVRIGDQVDVQSRTVKALVQVANSERLLKPGMYASVTLPVGGTAARVAVLSVPSAAVISDGAERFVFVETGQRTYVRRAVELASGLIAGGGPSSGRVAVVKGLFAGDRIVTHGAFALKSELAKASLKDVD